MSALLIPTGHGVAAALAIVPGDDPRPLALPGRAPLSLDEALATLHPDERRLAAALAPARRRDWIAGRAALRAALAAAGVACDVAVVADDRGAPVVPAATGSISHKRGLAVALAARELEARVGVDVELYAAPRTDIAARVLTDDERRSLLGVEGEARGRAVALRFSLKEAVYKAIDPYLRRYVGFREVAVWPADDGTARVDSALPVEVDAAWRCVGDLVVCTARARAV